jgi:peptidoglycan/LPS O-acetylase OafA/YrhL
MLQALGNALKALVQPVGGGKRSIELDALRFLAVALVLVRHFWVPPNAPEGLKPVLEVFQRGGWVGVDLFFVLSGFLISGLLFGEYQKHGNIRPARFLMRRALKIYPAFYFFLAFWILVGLRAGFTLPWGKVLNEALFLQNFRPGWRIHTWSLGVEEQFYLGFTALAFWLCRGQLAGRDPFVRLPWIGVLVGGLLFLLRLTRGWDGGLMRIDGLLCGVLLAYVFHFHPAPLRTWVVRYRWLCVAAVGLAFMLPFAVERGRWSNWVLALAFPCIYAGFTALLALCVCYKPLSQGWLSTVCHPLALIGAWSYSIYLWHWDVSVLVFRLVGKESHWLLQYAVYFLGAVFVGMATAQLVERPALKLRDRLFPSRMASALDAVRANGVPQTPA